MITCPKKKTKLYYKTVSFGHLLICSNQHSMSVTKNYRAPAGATPTSSSYTAPPLPHPPVCGVKKKNRFIIKVMVSAYIDHAASGSLQSAFWGSSDKAAKF